MKDLRKSVRVDAQVFISYDILDSDGRVIQAGMALSKDLSRKGVKIKDKNALPADTPIQFHLAVGEDVLHLTGEVKHIEKINQENYHIGVEFIEMGEDVLQKMKMIYPEIEKSLN